MPVSYQAFDGYCADKHGSDVDDGEEACNGKADCDASSKCVAYEEGTDEEDTDGYKICTSNVQVVRGTGHAGSRCFVKTTGWETDRPCPDRLGWLIVAQKRQSLNTHAHSDTNTD